MGGRGFRSDDRRAPKLDRHTEAGVEELLMVRPSQGPGCAVRSGDSGYSRAKHDPDDTRRKSRLEPRKSWPWTGGNTSGWERRPGLTPGVTEHGLGRGGFTSGLSIPGWQGTPGTAWAPGSSSGTGSGTAHFTRRKPHPRAAGGSLAPDLQRGFRAEPQHPGLPHPASGLLSFATSSGPAGPSTAASPLGDSAPLLCSGAMRPPTRLTGRV